MRIEVLELENFRNYRKLKFEFPSDQSIVVVGDNGLGKTNFLEAIHTLAVTKSFQTRNFEEMISWRCDDDARYLRVKGQVQTAGDRLQMEVFSGNSRQFPKTLRINGAHRQASDYVGNFLVTTFVPDDLNIVYLSPQVRRRYCDILLSQIDREYLSSLLKYRGCLAQRNRLLRDIGDRRDRADELCYWDEQLAEWGSYVLTKRRWCFEELNRLLATRYGEISGRDSDLRLRWKDWRSVEFNGVDRDEVRERLLRYFADERSRDIAAGATCGGPHREDFEFVMGGRNLVEFGSRGECRSAVLSLKMAEIELIEQVKGELPVMLLDDVFSELDRGRQQRLLEFIDRLQVVVTTTGVDFEFRGAIRKIEISEMVNG